MGSLYSIAIFKKDDDNPIIIDIKNNKLKTFCDWIKNSEIDYSFFSGWFTERKFGEKWDNYYGYWVNSSSFDDYITSRKKFYDEWLIEQYNIKEKMKTVDYLKLPSEEKNEVMSCINESEWFDDIECALILKGMCSLYGDCVCFIYDATSYNGKITHE